MNENRKRPYRVVVHLNLDELKTLNQNAEQAAYTRESYIRSLLLGKVPMPKPSDDFQEVIRQLRRIGNNINQLTVFAHKTGSMDILRFKEAMNTLNDTILELREKVYLPKESS